MGLLDRKVEKNIKSHARQLASIWHSLSSQVKAEYPSKSESELADMVLEATQSAWYRVSDNGWAVGEAPNIAHITIEKNDTLDSVLEKVAATQLSIVADSWASDEKADKLIEIGMKEIFLGWKYE